MSELSPTRPLRDRVRDALVRSAYAVGWRTFRHLPEGPTASVTERAARLVRRQNGVHVQTLRRNLELATSWPVGDDLLDRAIASYLRTQAEVLALPGWSRETVLGRVQTVNAEVLRSAYRGPGAVVALPHSGNWDLAGAWAAHQGMPVTSVAERLGDAEFDAFLRFRRELGIEVLSDRDPGVLGELAAAVRAGRLVCLVADRDLLGSGVTVSWAGRQVRMPAGPALVARRTGATLLPAICQYTPTGMAIVFGDPVVSRPGRDGLTQMTQQVADFFARWVARRPQDWHLMQPFFAAEERPW